MSVDDIISYCLTKKGAYLDFPFGEIPICVKAGNRLFAQIYPKPEDYKITLNCDAIVGEAYRSNYPGIVVRGYHCPKVQQPYFNTVILKDGFDDNELKAMIDHSYAVVVAKLSKKVRDKL